MQQLSRVSRVQPSSHFPRSLLTGCRPTSRSSAPSTKDTGFADPMQPFRVCLHMRECSSQAKMYVSIDCCADISTRCCVRHHLQVVENLRIGHGYSSIPFDQWDLAYLPFNIRSIVEPLGSVFRTCYQPRA